MNDIPYVDWLDGIEAYMERRNIQCHRVLELGCGTGRFTALLAADGYEVTGLDLSEAMIKVAKKKPFGKRISYVCSDMRNFNLGKKFDVVISVCDSMNYLLNNDDMYNTFLSVGKHLEKGGFFIFDLKTETFYEKLGENIYSDERNFGRYYWENEFDKETGDNFYYLSFFIKSMGKYKLYEEEHTQHVFTGTDIRECAAKAGFTVKDALSEDINSPIDFQGTGFTMFYSTIKDGMKYGRLFSKSNRSQRPGQGVCRIYKKYS